MRTFYDKCQSIKPGYTQSLNWDLLRGGTLGDFEGCVYKDYTFMNRQTVKYKLNPLL